MSQVLVKEENGVKTFYVYGLGLIGEEKEGEYRSYHFDFRGSTVALSDKAGKVVERFQYGPYGELVKGEVTQTPFLFNGKFGVMTEGNGLAYMRTRFYSPVVKRFVNQDVLLGNVAVGQSLNRYAFVTGRPVSLVDPFGLQMIPPEYSETANDMSVAPTSPEMNLLVSLLLGILPGGGEMSDAGILFNSSSSSEDKLSAGVSLVLSGVTAGISPNFGMLMSCRYTLGMNDLDWRGAGKTLQDALAEAFEKTGLPRDSFQVTKWGKDANGKSFPVEWRGPNGAEVSIDWAHYNVDRSGNWATGPDAPHVGWKSGKKGNKQVGHILLDTVPYNR